MTDKLPPNLLALFAPRPGLRYIAASDHAPETRSTSRIDGVAQYLEALKAPSEDYVPTESWLQRRDRVKAEKREKQQKLVTEGVSNFDPSSDPQVRGDKYKTLFVARLSYEAKESDLEREFGRFGPIERIRIVTDTHPDGKKGKKKPHRGYAFIVYEREKDLKAAYKETNGIRIKDRRVLVDVERGRTVPDWRPRRFGGGKGGRGYTKAAPPRPAAPGGFGPPAGPGGGLRGGFRGGFGGDRGGGFRGGRGGFGQPRGGIGYQGGGGFGGRGGYGGSPNGFSSSAPPPNAPSGPGGSGRFGSDRGGGGGFGSGGYGGDAPNGSGMNGGGYGDSRGGRSYDDRNSSFRGGRGFGDRGGDPRGASGSNREPVRPREDRGYGDRDRDRERGGYGGRYRDDDGGRKRHHDEDGYDDHRSKRRY